MMDNERTITADSFGDIIEAVYDALYVAGFNPQTYPTSDRVFKPEGKDVPFHSITTKLTFTGPNEREYTITIRAVKNAQWHKGV